MPDEKTQALLKDIRLIIMEMWGTHGRYLQRSITKAEAEEFFKKVEKRLEMAKVRIDIEMKELKAKLTELEEKAQSLEPEK